RSSPATSLPASTGVPRSSTVTPRGNSDKRASSSRSFIRQTLRADAHRATRVRAAPDARLPGPGFTEEQLVAFPQKNVDVGAFMERPHQHIGIAGFHFANDLLGDGCLPCTACSDERPHPVWRGKVGNPGT